MDYACSRMMYVLDFNHGNIIYTDVYVLSQKLCVNYANAVIPLYWQNVSYMYMYMAILEMCVLFMSGNSCSQLMLFVYCTRWWINFTLSYLILVYSIHVPGWLLKWLNLITAPGSVSNEPGSVTWLATKYLKTVSWRNHTEKLTTLWPWNVSFWP